MQYFQKHMEHTINVDILIHAMCLLIMIAQNILNIEFAGWLYVKVTHAVIFLQNSTLKYIKLIISIFSLK